MKNLLLFFLLSIPCIAITQADCDKFCVRDIAIDPEQPDEIQIMIYSSEEFVNQTFLDRVEDAGGEVIAGFGKFFHFYGHGRFQSQTYPLPTEMTSVPDDLKATVYFTFHELIDGIVQRTCALPYPCDVAKEIPERVEIFPNPIIDYFEVYFDNLEEELTSFNIFDMNGKIVLKRSTTRSNIYIKNHDLPAGIYIFQLRKGGELLATEKVVFQ